MATAEAAALDIHLHPLVVLSLADHYTREISQNPSGSRRCVGLLFGQQQGRVVRVLETVEMAFREEVKGQPILEQEAVETDMQLFSEAYANYECLGWYSSGSSITPYDYVLQKQLTKYNERPLFLLMDPAASGGRDLPLTLYEERTHVVADQASSEFVKTEYTVQADEAERIVVTYAAKVVNQEEAGSAGRSDNQTSNKHDRTEFARSLVSHYTTMIKSVESLKSRVSALHQFLLDVQSGKVDMARQQDQQILRDIKGLCHRLPVMTQDQFRSDLLAEYNDALLVTYLSSMTKGTQLMADVQDKFGVVHSSDRDEREGGHRGRGRPGMDEEMYGGRGAAGRLGGGPRGFMSEVMGSFGFGMNMG